MKVWQRRHLQPLGGALLSLYIREASEEDKKGREREEKLLLCPLWSKFSEMGFYHEK